MQILAVEVFVQTVLSACTIVAEPMRAIANKPVIKERCAYDMHAVYAATALATLVRVDSTFALMETPIARCVRHRGCRAASFLM